MKLTAVLLLLCAVTTPHSADAAGVKSLLHSVEKTVRRSMSKSSKKVTESDRLVRAIKDKKLDDLKGLLDQGSMPEVKGWSSLHIAGFTGVEGAINLLLAHGADPQAKDEMNMTALHLAQLAGKPNAVEILQRSMDPESLEQSQQDTNMFLQQAVIAGYSDDVKNLVELGHANIHTRTETQGWTALHLAAYQGNLKLVEYLLSQGARVDEKDSKGLRPLHLAMLGGYIPVVDLLRKEAGAEGAEEAEEVQKLFLETVKLAIDSSRASKMQGESGSSQGMRSMANLIGAGIDVNTKDESTGSTPAHVCARHNEVEILRFLVENGGEDSLLVQDQAGHTPLSVAQLHGSNAVVDYLSEKLGLTGDSDSEEDSQAEAGEKKSKGKSGSSGSSGKKKEEQRREALNKERGQIFLKSIKHALRPASAGGSKQESEQAWEVAQRVMETGPKGVRVDPNVRDDHKQWTALHWAALGGDEKITQYLLDHGADASLKDEDKLMAVHLAHLSGHRALVFLLRKAMGLAATSQQTGMDRAKVAAENPTPDIVELGQLGQKTDAESVLDRLLLDSLKFTLKSGQSQKLRNLLDTGANPAAKTDDDKQWTALHIAAHAGHTELLKLLVSHSASADAVDAKGFTPLHFAAHRGHLAAVELLVESGADLSIKEHNTGNTAQTLAEDQGHAEIAAYLDQVQQELDELAELEAEEEL